MKFEIEDWAANTERLGNAAVGFTVYDQFPNFILKNFFTAMVNTVKSFGKIYENTQWYITILQSIHNDLYKTENCGLGISVFQKSMLIWRKYPELFGKFHDSI